MTCDEVIVELKKLSNQESVKAMARFGISSKNTLGISLPNIRRIAKLIGKDHNLAQKLWDTQIHEARILAGFIDIPKLVTEAQMESWVKDFDSWDVCDQVCSSLFDKVSCSNNKAIEWSNRTEEFVKRAGFALMAIIAVHDKKADDIKFIEFLKIIKLKATDDRNFVKKAINWALRQIGKRNITLNKLAINTANEILLIDNKSAKWVATDAIKELTSISVKTRLGIKN